MEAYLEVLELCYFEVTEAFLGLKDEHVWRRPTETLLSIGELAGHISYWEAVRLAGEAGGMPSPDLSKCLVTSPLIDARFGYYPRTLAASPSEQHLRMTAEEVCRELVRVHTEAVGHLRALNPDPDSTPPGWSGHWTYRESLKYATFHIAYHTGQMYTARHLLGEETPDN